MIADIDSRDLSGTPAEKHAEAATETSNKQERVLHQENHPVSQMSIHLFLPDCILEEFLHFPYPLETFSASICCADCANYCLPCILLISSRDSEKPFRQGTSKVTRKDINLFASVLLTDEWSCSHSHPFNCLGTCNISGTTAAISAYDPQGT